MNHESLAPALKPHVIYIEKTSRRLAREVFQQMLKYQQRLESKQSILNRIVDIGTELFVMAASCAYADALSKNDQTKSNALDLADVFCCEARKRIEENFKASCRNFDKKHLSISKRLLSDQYAWLETDIIV